MASVASITSNPLLRFTAQGERLNVFAIYSCEDNKTETKFGNAEFLLMFAPETQHRKHPQALRDHKQVQALQFVMPTQKRGGRWTPHFKIHYHFERSTFFSKTDFSLTLPSLKAIKSVLIYYHSTQNL